MQTSVLPRKSSIKLRLWPSLDFTVGQAQPPKKDRERNPYTYERDAYWNGYRWQSFVQVKINVFLLRQIDRAAGELTLEQLGMLLDAYERGDRHQDALRVAEKINSYMGLSDATNSHKHSQQRISYREKRGSKGITAFGKRMVKSAGVLLERAHGLKNLMLGTATLPALLPDEMKLVCESWSELKRQFFQELQRLLERRGLSADYVCVTEIQEKRWQQWGVIAPHFHWVCQGRKNSRSHWAITPTEMKTIWQRLLSNLLGREVDGSASTRIECPRCSLGKELGKYLSKGGKVLKSIADANRSSELPSAWWGAARPLKQRVKQAVLEIADERAEYLDRNLERLQMKGIIQFRRVYQTIADSETGQAWERCVGVTGWFVSESAKCWYLENSLVSVAA